MPRFDTLSEVVLYVEAMDRTVAFYTQILNFDVAAGSAEHGFVEFDAGTCHLCLHAARHLADHGVALGDVRNPAPGVRVCDGRDPEGNSIEAVDVAG